MEAVDSSSAAEAKLEGELSLADNLEPGSLYFHYPMKQSVKTAFSVLQTHAAYLAWLQSIVATLGSLYFSEVMKLVPCTLCWYQRIAMYPLVLLLPVGIALGDTRLKFYVLPLSVIGWLIALYHNLLYYNILEQSIIPCQAGISCTTRYIEWFGFLTIPLLSLVAFTVIIGLMVVFRPAQLGEE